MPSAASTRSPRRARWRDPAGWPLRTRIVTTMIALLAVLGLVVGGTAELYLYQSLHQQVDTDLDELLNRLRGGPNGGKGFSPPDRPENDPNGGSYISKPPNSLRENSIIVSVSTSGSATGFRIVGTQGSLDNDFDELTESAIAAIRADVVQNGAAVDVDLGGDLPEYRVKAVVKSDGSIQYIGLPLDAVNSTLITVAAFTGCVVAGSLLIAGWGGALIVRRTLKPLDRVAATATRVSELKLDAGEVRLAQRVPEPDTDPRTEVGQVGAALNRMLDHVGNALEARHASEMQVRQFVADASHELRTPLAAIRGYAELSRRSRQVVPDEIAHVLNRVESEAKRMTALVEDLLLLARLDAGRPLAQDPVDLTMLAVDATSDAHAAGPAHYWQLDLPDEPVTVIGDGARLHQVVANLLANARTHTPEGSTVTVKVGAVPNAAVIQVVDNGPGIQPDVVPRIFERFARGDSSRSRAAGSTGLGLSIVHAVVTSHRGKVGVQSRPGQTIFTVMLPLGPPPVVPTAEQGPQMLHSVG
ncbi:sensor histidine kinase [Actinoplanes xinjiangensis]|jgi:two-component system OmpR family sensor kinase|uniref:histidine kinase n=2 Tax=Actinoplanes xinjiangensis TaxID=512350 RepID=A0A316F9I3_9ACTN|nr:HAMP domain-containing sensor histidine kinase [Actinoplanes xinjiangensis]PWK41959.1 two-component system OmpR family sensor kinase [Actinoplanes xinjiangensis]GIF41097.1 two-component sensor histidine kinase [Actinoplanes xinjiangensis]